MENFKKVYNENIFQIFPIWADLHGVNMISNMTYSNDEILKCYNSLTRLLFKQTSKYIRHNIEECMFYLTDIEVHKHPYFYVDIVVSSVLYYQEFPIHMQSDMLQNLSRIKDKCVLVEKITTNIINNSSEIKLTKYEINVSLNSLRERIKELKRHRFIYEILESTGVLNQFQRFEFYLQNRLELNENISSKISLGEEKYVKFIKIFFENKYDINLEIKKCEENLNLFYEKFNGIEITNEGYRDNTVYNNLKEVYLELRDLFGEVDFELDIIEDKKPGNSYFMTGNPPCYIQKTATLETQSKKKLNVIHEVYPGHYFLHKLMIKHDLNDLLMANDRFIEEGWSRFCEFYYAKYFGNTEEKKEVARKIYIMSLRAYVSISFHTEKMKPKEIIVFCMKYGLNKTEVLKLISSIIINPFEPLYYYFGFNLIKEKFEILKKKNIQNNLLYLLEEGKIYE